MRDRVSAAGCGRRREYENFDFRGEFFIRGWMDSGIYFHAPEHGRPIWNGMELHLFHNNEEKPEINSMGAILPVVPPLRINVRNKGEWNTFRILMDWPKLTIWTNDEVVQDLDVERTPELRHRFRRGYLGLQSLAYPIRFRNLRVRELPDKEKWQVLYGGRGAISPSGTSRTASRSSNRWARCCAPTVRATSAPTKSSATSSCSSTCGTPGSITAACCSARAGEGSRGRHYEIQLHDVEGAHYPHGVALSLQARRLPAHRGGEVVADATAGEGPLLHGADQRRYGARIRQAGEPGRGTHRVAGARAGPLDVHKEYPNKLAHSLNSDADVKPPRELTPAFYGCYDWHSSVHGHWLLARLARLYPEAEFAPGAKAALARSLAARNLAAKAAYLKAEGRASFERPYGLAWLLQLGAELRQWEDARAWSAALEPMERAAVERLSAWLPS